MTGAQGAGLTGAQVEALLRRTLDSHASDLHLDAGRAPTVRVDGRLSQLDHPVLSPQDTAACLAHMTDQRLHARFDERGELDFSFGLAGVGRFRVHAFRQRGSVGLALRAVPSDVPSWRDLGLPESVTDLVRQAGGLLVVAGRGGSGRSTTLAALVDLLNRERNLHIVTVEDPIEYLHRHRESIVNQREVGVDVRCFADATRAALREDPDVVLCGDLPDTETMTVVLGMAATGRLVLAALPTADAVSTLTHITRSFPVDRQPQVRLQLAETLLGIVSQELLPRADRAGRVAAFEVLVATAPVRNLVREGKWPQLSSLIQTGSRYGMRSREASLRQLLEHGAITEEEFQGRSSG